MRRLLDLPPKLWNRNAYLENGIRLNMSEKPSDLLADQPVVVNVGLIEFFHSLIEQEVEAVHVD